MIMSVIPNSVEDNSQEFSSQPNFDDNDELKEALQRRDSKGLRLSK